MEKATLRDYVQAFIGIYIVVASTVYLVAISFNLIEHDNQNISAILPIFNSILLIAVGFYLGSSLSNKTKDDTINSLTIPPANATVNKTESTTTKIEPEVK
jgi:uncharacterized membrane protein